MIITEKRNDAALSLVSIYEISKILSASTHLEGSLRAVLNLMSSYLEMRRGVVAVVDADGGLDIVSAGGGPEIETAGPSLPEDVVSRILAGEMPFVTEDIAEHPLLSDYVGVSGALDDERVSFIGVPIRTVGRPFGVLAVARVWEDANAINFGDDVRFLTMVANLIAQTVKLHRSNRPPRDPSAPIAPARCPRRGRTLGLPASLDGVIGHSQPMQEVFAQVHLVAPTRSAVIVRGESGTGKELIARAVHLLSPRKEGPFVKVNCAALPDTLLESELFGHEKGAFTGATAERKGRLELADGGTLFLDEIGDVSPAFQAKLLRALQEREFERVGGTKTVKADFRLVTATNRNLEEAVAKGDFRADLYYRINVVPVFMPALRERQEDIPLLALHFLARFNAENDRNLTFSERSLALLSTCAFPGNVRELENCVNRAATMTVGEVINDIDVPCRSPSSRCHVLMPRSAFGSAGDECGDTEAEAPAAAELSAADWRSVDDLDDLDALSQRERLIRVMEKAGWVQAKAARLLGITPRQVGYALRKHNIEIKRL